ncbi:hypothetical protein COPCOM_01088 [Coprococcus comes ATCC 27758]|uniref:Uncharacterized protein n=1 Tax=Coprococcus comes ATCC 27758 TaxID=470146 RepID=C0B7G7_9FIRM|nr:hypothetical protein COPCOM_01088 [Coprococcus comes ATCC 27758]
MHSEFKKTIIAKGFFWKLFEIRNEVREKQRKKGVKRKWNKSICSQIK